MAQKIIHEVPAKHVLAAVLQSDTVLGQVHRELYRLLPGVNIKQLRQMLRDELLRPEVVEGSAAEEAHLLLERMRQLQARGLTMTQTLKTVSTANEDEDEDAFQILMEDKRTAGGGG